MRTAGAIEWTVESSISTRVEYNDNIFLLSGPQDTISSSVIMPSIKVSAKESDWETFIDSKLSNNNYSDHDLDSNDKYFDITSRHFSETDLFSLNGTYDLDSSLNFGSSIFGITASRVNRKLWSIAPQYARQITERLTLHLNYNHTDVEYLDSANVQLVDYGTDVVSGSFIYNLTELSELNFNLQAVDYESKNKSFEYQMIISRVGMSHKLSESFSIDYQVGGSRRDSTRRATQAVDFFGVPVILIQDFSSNGFVIDAGFENSWEVSSLSGRVSRDNTTDSFGGLNEVDVIQFDFKQHITQLWHYSISTKYEDVASVSVGNIFLDRKLISFEPILRYSLDKDWGIHASYRYVQREFKGSSSSGSAPYSNRVFVGITYNFPSLSTF